VLHTYSKTLLEPAGADHPELLNETSDRSPPAVFGHCSESDHCTESDQIPIQPDIPPASTVIKHKMLRERVQATSKR